MEAMEAGDERKLAKEVFKKETGRWQPLPLYANRCEMNPNTDNRKGHMKVGMQHLRRVNLNAQAVPPTWAYKQFCFCFYIVYFLN